MVYRHAVGWKHGEELNISECSVWQNEVKPVEKKQPVNWDGKQSLEVLKCFRKCRLSCHTKLPLYFGKHI